ncbi:NmrA/HSCARG family protein [Spongiactinospora rosea]|uniref:NmrA/HSCARG family protein n=1 Tax=Spongiactinospora rosea TaxID=2248750 RepID=A0A366LRF6_9ACTN|nr:NmrA/HSCARG family protein [Spongiactinospora rosea]RBQ15969.1 NmrA/HSCARG family protein [Spongiactinospora rosea]
MPNGRIALVTGATGGQGGAVTRALLARGWSVRALVRDPHTDQAAALSAAGAELATGTFEDDEALRKAMTGVDGVFSVQPADFADPYGGTEVRQGVAVADAALETGVPHLVYSSVGGAERRSGIAHFETKAQVERHIAAIGVPATVLRPVFFMENWPYMVPEPDGSGERVVPLALSADTKLQMIGQADVGRIAAEVFCAPGEFLGRRIEIAGDELTVTEIAEVLTRVGGVPTRFVRQSLEELRAEAEEAATMFEWFENKGYQADLPALRERFPGLVVFETWLREVR